jgi:Protein of unknown function (DUF5818)
VNKYSVLRFTLLLLFGVGLMIEGAQSNVLKASVSPVTTAWAQPGDEPEVTAFTGKIVSQNGVRYILRDDANEVWYHLDDQEQAQKYFGKNVMVMGVLDGRSDMIRVRNIVEAK